jgi:nucleoid-associated protein YgaU
MASRYDTRRLGVNSTEAYSKMLESRNVKLVRQYFTPDLKYPDPEEISRLNLISHTWKSGDRFFKLAHKYYNDASLWWVIAWFNQTPTESHLEIGDVVEIPSPLERVLSVLGL